MSETKPETIELTPDEVANFIAEGLQRAGRVLPNEVLHVKWVYEGIPLLVQDTEFMGARVERLGVPDGSLKC